MGREWAMEGLSLQSRMARYRLNTTLKLLKSSTIRTAEKIQSNKKKVIERHSNVSGIIVCIFVSIIFISGLISLLGLYQYII